MRQVDSERAVFCFAPACGALQEHFTAGIVSKNFFLSAGAATMYNPK
jgi:hypothetical protein